MCPEVVGEEHEFLKIIGECIPLPLVIMTKLA